MVVLVRAIIVPSGFSSLLARVFGVFAMLAIIKYVFKYGLGPIFLLLVDKYEEWMSIVFDWAVPYVGTALALVGSYLNLDLVLHSHWKHIFVLMGIYFFRDAQNAYSEGAPFTATFHLILGFTIALAASAFAGALPPDQVQTMLNFGIAAIPVAGLFLYSTIGCAWGATVRREQDAVDRHLPTPLWREAFMQRFLPALSRTMVALFLIVVGLQVPWIRQVRSPSLALLGLLVILLALYWLWEGLRDSRLLRTQDESRMSSFLRSRYAKVGLSMLSVYFWVTVALVSDVGLSLAGGQR